MDDPQHIIAVCDANWDAHKSDCSGLVKAVSSALGVTTFQPSDDADSIVDKLRSGSDWTALGVGNGLAAKTQADAGVFVVAGLKGAEQVQPDDNADSIMDKLRSGSDWTALGVGNGLVAKAQADAGVLVVAGLKGAEQVQPDPHGHVVVVVSGPLDAAHGQYPTGYWGRLGSVGAKATSLNFAWRAGDRDQVGYFAKAL